MSGNYSYTESLSFRTTDFQSNSKAAASAMRALQLKVKTLETDKENLQNHINYLLTLTEKPSPNRNSPQAPEEYPERLDFLTTKIHKLNDAYAFQQQKADFLDKELKRKEQQFLLDRDTWELEIKALKKELLKSRGRVMSPKAKKIKKSPKKTENCERVPELLRQIEKITVDLKKSEGQKEDLEGNIRKLRVEYGENLRVLQEELENIKQTSSLPRAESPQSPLPSHPHRFGSSNELLEIKKDLDYYKNLARNQESHINELIFEVENLKFELQKFNNMALYMGKGVKSSEDKKEDNLQEDGQELEGKVNNLSKKYKGLLEKTGNPNENTPELREELKKTALELETESCNLYSLRKNKRDNIKEKLQDQYSKN